MNERFLKANSQQADETVAQPCRLQWHDSQNPLNTERI